MSIAATNTDQPIPRHRVLAKVAGKTGKGYDDVLTPDALLFLADLERRFGPQRRILLENRRLQQERFDDGEFPTQPLRQNIFAIAYGRSTHARPRFKTAALK